MKLTIDKALEARLRELSPHGIVIWHEDEVRSVYRMGKDYVAAAIQLEQERDEKTARMFKKSAVEKSEAVK